ncbi:MAG TPA: ABC transporter permease [Bacillota bacterium]|nr:ABC transporter permease [Bacillota bacterium]
MKKILKRLLKNPISLTGIILLIIFIVVAILAPLLAPPRDPGNPYQIPRRGWALEPSGPTSQYIFGLTQGSYDIYYGIIWGTRTAFRVGLIIVLFSALIGITLGSISAYYGGILDEFLMRFTDIFMSFPTIIFAVIFTVIFGIGLNSVMIALILFGWMSYARLIRGNILAAKREEYVLAARAIGVSDFKIITRHILPNTIFPVLIQASMSLGSVVITASAMSFLGLGAPEGFADWGQMVNFARNWMLGEQKDVLKYWFTVIYPGAAIVLFVLAWNLVGDALRDIMDPKLQA